MNPANDWREWTEKAENDFLSIDNNLRSARVPWDAICFHAQQAAEKYRKGFLVAHRNVPAKTPDLPALLTACTQLDSSLASLDHDCRELNQYAVIGRYPGGQAPPEQKCRELVEAARRVKAAVSERISP